MQNDDRRKNMRIFLPGGQVRLSSGMILVLVGKIMDISIGGARLFSSAEFNVGDELELELTLPSGIKFKCLAKIIHVETIAGKENEKNYGVKFIDLNSHGKIALGNFITQKLNEQKEGL